MNKKFFIGTAALTTVVVGGYVYYRYTQGRDVTKEIRERALRLFAPDQTDEEVWEESLLTEPPVRVPAKEDSVNG